MKVKNINESKYEALSALIDNECEDTPDLLKQISADSDLSARWGEYHRARAAMHGDYMPALDDDFSNRVSAALKRESAIRAPCVVRFRALKRSMSWQKPVLGIAIAATVAAVSVFGLNKLSTTPKDYVPAIASHQAGNVNTQAVTQIIAPGGNGHRASLPVGTHWHIQRVVQQRDTALEERLNRYLADHMEYANSGKVQGMLPYSRLVAYDTTQ